MERCSCSFTGDTNCTCPLERLFSEDLVVLRLDRRLLPDCFGVFSARERTNNTPITVFQPLKIDTFLVQLIAIQETNWCTNWSLNAKLKHVFMET